MCKKILNHRFSGVTSYTSFRLDDTGVITVFSVGGANTTLCSKEVIRDVANNDAVKVDLNLILAL